MLARLAPAALAALVIVPAIGPARADDDNKALATELFSKGNKKLEAGHCDAQPIKDRAACEEARDNFLRAYELYPLGLGALRNLAYVERGLGRYASAARHFRELQQKAPHDPNPKRHVWAEYAAKELEVIEPLVPRLTVEPPTPRPDGLTISVDDKPLPKPVWGTAIEIDPGAHKVTAEAAAVTRFESNVTLEEKDSKTVTIVFEAAAPPPWRPPLDNKPKEPTSRVVPLVVAGVGGLTMVVGLGFGYAAITGKQDACGGGKLCEREGLDQARSYAATSNILTGIGAAVLIGGTAWYFLAPKSTSNTTGVHIVPFAGGAGIVGRF
jgi:hypothetical protein